MMRVSHCADWSHYPLHNHGGKGEEVDLERIKREVNRYFVIKVPLITYK
jgi:hypothetical protein